MSITLPRDALLITAHISPTMKAVLSALPLEFCVFHHIETADDFLHALATASVDLVLLDMYLGDDERLLSLVEQAQQANPTLPILIGTHDGTRHRLAALYARGATDELPADFPALIPRRLRHYAESKQLIVITEERRLAEVYNHVIAHNLRSPLNMMMYLADFLNEMVEGEGQEFAQKIITLATNMSEMLTQLLRVQTLGDLEASVGPLDTIRLDVEAALLPFEQEIQARGITVTVADTFPIGLGYRPWVREILVNLINNAVKYIGKHNPAPQIWIDGILEETVVKYRVRDNGLGIPPEHRDTIWERFKRVHRDETMGFGLGLYIVSELVKFQGGTVGFESEEGQGSTFWFTLPKAASSL